MSIRSLSGGGRPAEQARTRTIELGNVVLALPDGTLTFTLEDAGDKVYSGRYQRPRPVTLIAADHTHVIVADDDVPPTGLPCVALFHGSATSQALVLLIGWP